MDVHLQKKERRREGGREGSREGECEKREGRGVEGGKGGDQHHREHTSSSSHLTSSFSIPSTE